MVFASDHGTQAGAHADEMQGPDWHRPWDKMVPHEESIHVPLLMRLPGVLDGRATRDTLIAPVDMLPSLCCLCGMRAPRTVEGHDLSAVWRNEPRAFEQDAVLTMNFSASYTYLEGGMEWRRVRTKRYSHTRWLNGRRQLFDLERDPLQKGDLHSDPAAADVRRRMEERLESLMKARGDELPPAAEHRSWFDGYRRVVRTPPQAPR